jgi:MFS family permease
MSQWTIQSHEAEILFPIFLFGIGLGAIFPIVTALGIGQINRERMGFASSLFSMMINTGAAAGIAIATNLLATGHRRHEAQILATLSSPAHLTGILKSQAWLFAYNDVYQLTAIMLLLLCPWAFFLRRAPLDTNAAVVVE